MGERAVLWSHRCAGVFLLGEILVGVSREETREVWKCHCVNQTKPSEYPRYSYIVMRRWRGTSCQGQPLGKLTLSSHSVSCAHTSACACSSKHLSVCLHLCTQLWDLGHLLKPSWCPWSNSVRVEYGWLSCGSLGVCSPREIQVLPHTATVSWHSRFLVRTSRTFWEEPKSC